VERRWDPAQDEAIGPAARDGRRKPQPAHTRFTFAGRAGCNYLQLVATECKQWKNLMTLALVLISEFRYTSP
jgi:hypothetical protein